MYWSNVEAIDRDENVRMYLFNHLQRVSKCYLERTKNLNNHDIGLSPEGATESSLENE